MRIRTFALAGMAFLAVTGTASAADTSWYVGLGAGWSSLAPAAFSYTVGPQIGRVDLKQSWRGLAAIGYAWDNHVRLEAEFAFADPGARQAIATSPAPGGAAAMMGDFQTTSLMANALYDIPLSEKASVTLGGGLGTTVTNTKASTPVITLTGSPTALTWQLIGGVAYRVSPDIDLQLDYRYVSSGKVEYKDTANHIFALNALNSHNVMVSLRWYFDQAAPPPPPPPPPPSSPPPPPPPPPPPEPVKTYIVYFDFAKANLSQTAQETIQEAMRVAKANGFTRVELIGHTDTVGSSKYNMKLSLRRAAAVKEEMVREGMDGSRIKVVGKSLHDPLVLTPPDKREQQNRAVVIQLDD